MSDNLPSLVANGLPETPEERSIEARTFELKGEYARYWEEYEEIKRLADEYSKKLESWKARWKQIFGDRDIITLDGVEVATNAVSGPFKVAQFRKEHPAIYQAYLVKKTQDVFDEEMFKAHNPQLWNDFRSTSIRHK